MIVFSPQAAGWLWKINSDGSDLAPAHQQIFDGSRNCFAPLARLFAGWRTSPVHARSLSPTTHGRRFREAFTSVRSQARQRELCSSAVSNVGYANGYLFYLDDKKSLRATLLDLAKGACRSDSLRRSPIRSASSPPISWGAFSVAENGTIVYNPTVGATLSVLDLVRPRRAKNSATLAISELSQIPTLSPDGSRLAIDIADAKANNVNIWLRRSQTWHQFPLYIRYNGRCGRRLVARRDLIAYRSLQANDTNLFVKQAQGLQPRQCHLLCQSKRSRHG